MKRRLFLILTIVALSSALGSARKSDAEKRRHGSGLASAPESAHVRRNPYEGSADAALAGEKLFKRHCTECHGIDARGSEHAPPLDSASVYQAPPGDLFWFLTNGNLWRGMPSWSRLPDAQRWQIVSYLKTLRKPPGNRSSAVR
jgi:mono/diheme cytochrome c family protein